MDPNTLNCIIAIGIVILLVILVWGIMRLRASREKKSNIKRREARQAWTDDYQDQKDIEENEQDRA